MTCNSFVNDVKSRKISDFQGLSNSHLGHKSLSLKFFEMDVFLLSIMQQEWTVLLCSVQYSHWKHSGICMYLLITEYYLTYVAPSWYFTINVRICLCLKEMPPIHNICTQKFQASNSRNLKFHEHLCIKTTISKLSQVDGLPSINFFLTCLFIFIRYWLDLRTEQT